MDMDYFNDKRWMYEYKTKPTRCHPRFVAGVNFFIDYAKEHVGVQGSGLMRCPCRKCENIRYFDCETIKTHIVLEGFFPLYRRWLYHGEQPQNQSDINVPPVQDTVFGGHKGGYEREVGTGAQLRSGASSSSLNYLALSEQLEKERRHTEALSQKVDAISQRMERLEMLIIAQSQQGSSNNGGNDQSRH